MIGLREYFVLLKSLQVTRAFLSLGRSYLESFSESKIMSDMVGLLGWPDAISPTFAFEPAVAKVYKLQLTALEILAAARSVVVDSFAPLLLISFAVRCSKIRIGGAPWAASKR